MSELSRREVVASAAALATTAAAGIVSAAPAAAQPARPAATTIVDANMHWLPENLFSDNALLDTFVGSVPREYGIHAKLAPVPGRNLRQIVIEHPKGYEVLNYAENQYNAKDQVTDMQAAKVDKAILRLPCWQEWLDLEACRKINNGLAEHAKRYPGKFYPLAVAPPWGA